MAGLTPTEAAHDQIRGANARGITVTGLHVLYAIMKTATRIMFLIARVNCRRAAPPPWCDPAVVKAYLGERWILLEIKNLNVFYGPMRPARHQLT